MYLFVFLYTTFYFYLVERANYKNGLGLYLIPFCLYAFVAGSQYAVGTDYFSYVYIFDNPIENERYFNKGEYIFFYLVEALNWLGFESQSLFYTVSIIQSFFVFYIAKKMKDNDSRFLLVVWFFCFFCITNIYQNQLNGIRQYVAVVCLPIALFYLSNKKVFKSFLFFVFAVFFHSSSIVFLLVLPVVLLSNVNRLYSLFAFIVTPVFYLYIPSFIEGLLGWFGSAYLHYLDSDLAASKGIMSVVTKLYYAPLYFIIAYFYTKRRFDCVFTKQNFRFFNVGMIIFFATYWSFLSTLELGILNRIFNYFVFFGIFPCYYVLAGALKEQRMYLFWFVVLYLALPYVAKITFLARAEFLYKSYIFT